MRVLVTGISGFAGPWVARALAEAGHEVHGLVRGPGPWPRLAGVPLHRAELDDAARVVHEVLPDALVHLAAVSALRPAEEDPAGAYRTNLAGTLAVLAAVRTHAPRARVLAVTSVEVYGAVEPGELPVGEDTPLRPLTVYGASKAAADIAAGQWARAYGLDVVRARPFNHTGPGQEPAFLPARPHREPVLARVKALRCAPTRIGLRP